LGGITIRQPQVRKLRRAILEHQAKTDHTEGKLLKYDLEPERQAVSEWLRVLHTKLKID
jgi:hypothetical protein